MMLNEKAEKVISLAESQMGYPYVFGAIGEDCTPSKRGRRQSSAHPTIKSKCQVLNGSKSTCDGCKWEGARMFDCRGFTYWCLKQVDITISTVGATTQYNRTQDWLLQGKLSDMPNVVCCVFQKSGSKMAHTGLHIGDGKIIHCSNGVQTGKTTDQGWTHFAIPKGLYTSEEISKAGGVHAVATLRTGSKGDAVKTLQEMLNSIGYDCGTADGVYGAKTKAAVEAFQQAKGLTVDGIAGEQTQTVLLLASTPSQTVSAQSDEDLPVQTPERVLVALDRETAQKVYQALKAVLSGEAVA